MEYLTFDYFSAPTATQEINMGNTNKISGVIALVFLLCGVAQTALAEINEPDYLLYGTIIVKQQEITRNDAIRLDAYLDGVFLDSYAMGDDHRAGDHFLLSIPVDSIGAGTSGKARVGDEIEIVIHLDFETTARARVVLEDRGLAVRVDARNIGSDSFNEVIGPDQDTDGVVNVLDNCIALSNQNQLDSNSDGVGDACTDLEPIDDPDGDGIDAGDDNCRHIANQDQRDTDEDGLGDACDFDIDDDLILNVDDNCPIDANFNQDDKDSDGQGDACDACIDDAANNCDSICLPVKSKNNNLILICL